MADRDAGAVVQSEKTLVHVARFQADSLRGETGLLADVHRHSADVDVAGQADALGAALFVDARRVRGAEVHIAAVVRHTDAARELALRRLISEALEALAAVEVLLKNMLRTVGDLLEADAYKSKSPFYSPHKFSKASDPPINSRMLSSQLCNVATMELRRCIEADMEIETLKKGPIFCGPNIFLGNTSRKRKPKSPVGRAVLPKYVYPQGSRQSPIQFRVERSVAVVSLHLPGQCSERSPSSRCPRGSRTRCSREWVGMSDRGSPRSCRRSPWRIRSGRSSVRSRCRCRPFRRSRSKNVGDYYDAIVRGIN